MIELTLMQKIAIWTLPVLMAITLHEAAHGWVASKLGDKTAQMLGRVTINPLKHIDPIGTLLVPIVLLILGGFVFGWAKAVPITPRNFKNPVRDMAWVAVAGPLSNLLMAIGWAMIAKFGYMVSVDGADSMSVGAFLTYSGLAGVAINLVLMVLNLIPIPPLDGSRVLSALLPNALAYRYNQLESYGLFILLGLLLLGVLGPIISGPYQAIQGVLLNMVGL
ncbi:MAG: site-2 protease family protein [Piscirickettsiaceae bacterium CG_4_9_14_3_um_filter_43_564]|nr:site-2 protease family protein [Thiomicrospira sp.]OIP94182.1 MAG: site-2 protease family protein [Thiomicrospira sp. CG2_30_44_34]PIQ03798.1 MAG: site-2 protease family protein [Piscirickettsiaceae bacterium CG18_big_fil_WC_8_21_14_2_50_44_103]PIU39684.1 MAG: site-2 protease family protein [Piscirickettsiaceae bacterium CG07_land_8_20_14_0_80_44_28]PIW57984.1 MAG: site-2 protease family protein [Piscirickettsiaceae bacterium CG12_big_fil_rev_8_21_14_0_65_44_934]PIW77733.1 MAG: site-2 prote